MGTVHFCFRGVGRYFSFYSKLDKKIMQANSGDPDQRLHSAASGLGLHYLPTSHKRTQSLYGLTYNSQIGVKLACYRSMNKPFLYQPHLCTLDFCLLPKICDAMH